MAADWESTVATGEVNLDTDLTPSGSITELSMSTAAAEIGGGQGGLRRRQLPSSNLPYDR
jgi:hypothetical protein